VRRRGYGERRLIARSSAEWIFDKRKDALLKTANFCRIDGSMEALRMPIGRIKAACRHTSG
jgi:hypothetical protein